MISKNFRSKIGRVALAASLLIGITVAVSATAQAQGRRDGWDRGGYGRGDYGRGAFEFAQNQGFQDGVNTGASDARRGQSYDPYRSHFYKNGAPDHRDSYGNREAFRQAYRSGFLRGYQEGFRRFAGRYRRRW